MRTRYLRRIRTAVIVGLLALLSAPAWSDVGSDEAQIRRRLEDWAIAFNAGNATAACDLFAPDLVYSIPEIPQGSHESMCANLKRVLARSDIRFQYDPPAIHEILVSGDLAVVRLAWTLKIDGRGASETSVEEGMDIFRRQADGRWSIARFVAFTPQASP